MKKLKLYSISLFSFVFLEQTHIGMFSVDLLVGVLMLFASGYPLRMYVMYHEIELWRLRLEPGPQV